MSRLTKIGFTEHLPAVLARPAQPYVPPTPAWTEYRQVRSCVTEPATSVWRVTVEAVFVPYGKGGSGSANETPPPPGGTAKPGGEYIYRIVNKQTVIPGKEECSSTTVKIDHPASPGQPFIPAVGAQPERIEQKLRAGWNSGAISIVRLEGPNGYKFKVPVGSVGVVAGLTDATNPTHPNQIKHGLYASRGTVQVMESGSPVGLPQPYTGADELIVKRKRTGHVLYVVAGNTIHTSLSKSIGSVSLGATFYLAGDSVSEAAYYVDADTENTSAGAMRCMTGLSGNTPAAISAGVMHPLRPFNGAFSYTVMKGMAGICADKPFCQSIAYMLEMKGLAYGPPAVSTGANLAEHYLHPMVGFSTGQEIRPVYVWGVARPLAGMAGDKYSNVAGSIAPAIGFATGIRSYAKFVLPMLAANSVGPITAISVPTLTVLSTGAAVVPGSGYAHCSVPTLTVLSTGLPASDARFFVPPLTVLATGSSIAYANYAHFPVPSLRANAVGLLTRPNSSRVNLPVVTTAACSGASADFSTPAVISSSAATSTGLATVGISTPRVQASGRGGATASAQLRTLRLYVSTTMTGVSWSSITIPKISTTSSATVGGVARTALGLKALTASSSASTPATARVEARLPVPTINAVGVLRSANTSISIPAILAMSIASGPNTGRANVRVRAMTLGSRCGGTLSCQMPMPSASSSGVVGQVANASVHIPAMSASAVARREASGCAHIQLPLLSTKTSAKASVRLPRIRSSSMATSEILAVVIEAYVMNMGRLDETQPINQVTRYTGLPFARIVRFLGDYYGVSETGLYKLGGNTDDGADIEWSFTTGTTDFGDSTKKTLASVYMGGQIGSEATFTVSCGELPDQMHAYDTTSPTAVRNHRQRFGLGRRARYYSLGVSGSGDMNLDSLEFEVLKTNRRI